MRPEDADKTSTEPQPGLELRQDKFSDTVRVQLNTSADMPERGTSIETIAWVGKSLGKYKVSSILGRGAMGVVLKAHDPLIERDIAIKVLADHLAADATALGRFLEEAKSAGKINHPNVVAIYEICQDEALTYIVLEYAPCGSLEEWLILRRVLSVPEATQALIEACKGVAAAHAAGLIHRDIKPANFMRAADGSIKVADFGLGASRRPQQRAIHADGDGHRHALLYESRAVRSQTDRPAQRHLLAGRHLLPAVDRKMPLRRYRERAPAYVRPLPFPDSRSPVARRDDSRGLRPHHHPRHGESARRPVPDDVRNAGRLAGRSCRHVGRDAH